MSFILFLLSSIRPISMLDPGFSEDLTLISSLYCDILITSISVKVKVGVNSLLP